MGTIYFIRRRWIDREHNVEDPFKLSKIDNRISCTLQVLTSLGYFPYNGKLIRNDCVTKRSLASILTNVNDNAFGFF